MNTFLKFIFLYIFISLGSIIALEAHPIPKLTGRVVDNANMLSVPDRNSITETIKNLEHDTGGQMAVLTVNSLGNETIEEFAERVERNWKIGYKGKDNGILLVIVKDSKKIRLEVGYGWEQYVTDARAGDIIRAMGPYFRKGEYCKGILLAVNDTIRFVTKNNFPKKNYTQKR